MICPKCERELPPDSVFCCYCGKSLAPKKPSRVHQRANGTGSAYKCGKTWRAVVVLGWVIDEKGKKQSIRKTKRGFKTRDKALAYCAKLFAELPARKAPTLSHYWDLYEKDELEKLGKSKKCAYRIAWNRMKTIAERPVDQLTVADLRRVVADNTQTHYPARDMKTLLNHLFYLAGADRFVDKELPSFIILPELNETERNPFTDDEQKAIWAAYENGYSDCSIPLIMIYTGMMTGEMRDLTVEMINFEARRITGVGLKTDIRRESPVYLPDDILPVLQDAIDHIPVNAADAQTRDEMGRFVAVDPVYDPDAPKTGLVFPCSEDTFYSRYYAALEKAGVRRLTPYSCRHTTATALAIDENIAPETVRKVMRWSSTVMLKRYAHPDDSDALAAINTMKRKTGEEAEKAL